MILQHPPYLLRKNSALVLCLIFILLVTGTAVGEVLDRVVAVVNSDVILLSDVEAAGIRYFQQIKEKTPEGSLQDAMLKAKEEIRDDLIDKSLVTQQAKKEKISVTDEDLQHAYQTMIKHSGLSEDQFVAKVKESGLTISKYKDRLKYQVLQEKLINHDIRSRVVITDTMVKAYYDAHKAEYTRTESGYALLQMGFTWGRSPESQQSQPALYADKVDAKRRAEEVRKLALEGQDFRELAKKYSNLPSAPSGGDIGILQEGDMESDMRDAITHLKPGDISKIIETPAGFQFFKLLADRNGADPKSSYESAQEGIREILFQQQMKKEFEKWVKNLKQQAYIKKMPL